MYQRFPLPIEHLTKGEWAASPNKVFWWKLLSMAIWFWAHSPNVRSEWVSALGLRLSGSAFFSYYILWTAFKNFSRYSIAISTVLLNHKLIVAIENETTKTPYFALMSLTSSNNILLSNILQGSLQSSMAITTSFSPDTLIFNNMYSVWSIKVSFKNNCFVLYFIYCYKWTYFCHILLDNSS